MLVCPLHALSTLAGCQVERGLYVEMVAVCSRAVSWSLQGKDRWNKWAQQRAKILYSGVRCWLEVAERAHMALVTRPIPGPCRVVPLHAGLCLLPSWHAQSSLSPPQLSVLTDPTACRNMESSVPGVFAAGDACCIRWPDLDQSHWFQMRLWTQVCC